MEAVLATEAEIEAERNKRTDWDARFLALAAHVAQWSKDPSTKTGAVLVGQDRRKIAVGYNGFPPGIADDERLLDRKTKYQIVVHAEQNALDNATFDTTGATIYCTHPCLQCAKAIISKRLARVVCPPPPPAEEGRWTAEIPLARALLDEAGVEVTHYGEA